MNTLPSQKNTPFAKIPLPATALFKSFVQPFARVNVPSEAKIEVPGSPLSPFYLPIITFLSFLPPV
jgi:hypothetical protein